MRLTTAGHLGHYAIHALLGAGGMGEVYRATDTRFGREGALKVLSAEMAADHDRHLIQGLQKAGMSIAEAASDPR